MLWAGGGEQPRRWPGTTGSVVAGCLVVAALLSAFGIVLEVVGFPGLAISDRVIEVGFVALMPVSLALAAVVALTMAAPRDRRVPGGWSDRAQALVAVVVAIAILTSLYATFAATTGWSFAGRMFPGGISWTARFGFAGAALACVFVGASALSVVARSWRDISAAGPPSLSAAGADRAADPTGLLPWSTIGPAIVCVLLATLAMSAVPVDRLFSSGGSIGQRVASASGGFSSLPIALTAVAFVALVAFARRNEARDPRVDFMVTIAALVGALAVAAGAYTTWLIVSGDTVFPLSRTFFDWWGRAGGVADALASAAAGAAACYPVWRWRRADAIRPPVPDGVDEWSEPLRGPETQPSVLLSAVAQVPPLVGAGLAVAAVGSALSNAALVVATRGPIPIGSLVAEMGDGILLTTGLALAAAIVLVVTRAEPIERRSAAAAANVALTLVALGALATSVYTVYFVTVGRHDSRYLSFASLLTRRHGYVATAIAFGLLAIGTLALTTRALRESSVDTDRGDDVDVEVVELQPG